MLCACLTSLNASYNGPTARKIGSQKDRQYKNKTPLQLAKIKKQNARKRKQAIQDRAIEKNDTILKYSHNELSSDQQYTLLTWLGVYHGSTPQEAQQQYTEEETVAYYTQMYDEWEVKQEREIEIEERELDEDLEETNAKTYEKEDAQWFEKCRQAEIEELFSQTHREEQAKTKEAREQEARKEALERKIEFFENKYY